MKKSFFYFLLLSLVWASCSDTKPTIFPKENPFEIFPTHMSQHVLVESFVAEWTSETIVASLLQNDLKNQHPNKIHVANFHLGDWLEMPESNQLGDNLGGLLTIPRSAINRTPGSKTINNEDNITLLTKGNWENAVNQSISSEAKVSLAIGTSMNGTKGFVNVYVAHKQALPANTHLTLYFIKDNIPALFQTGASDVFMHNNVSTLIFPSLEGELIDLTEESINGIISKYSFSDIDLTSIDVSNLKVIAFIHTSDIDFNKIRVLNSQEAKWGGNKYWD